MMDLFVGALNQGAGSHRSGNGLLCILLVLGVCLVAAIRSWED